MTDTRTTKEKETDRQLLALQRAIARISKKLIERTKRIEALEARPTQVV